mmetsp:Transcript_7452/g.16470  ORF Transcript_7452/g.16470 Transcript_7452/m.16470 type:complete len:552 (+) Transcript_7452:33-1688(+)
MTRMIASSNGALAAPSQRQPSSTAWAVIPTSASPSQVAVAHAARAAPHLSHSMKPGLVVGAAIATAVGTSLAGRRKDAHLGRWLRGVRGNVRYSGQVAQRAVPTWEELREEIEATPSGQRLKAEEEKRAKGLSPHTDAKLRRFSSDEGPPRVTLFRDTAAWCPYCQKVWLLLEAKGVDFKVEKINMRSYGDKPEWFLEKVPRGLLPAVEIDGRFMTESLDIMMTIESTFHDEDKPMMPREGVQRSRAIQLLELERQVFGAWCSFLFYPSLPFLDSSTSDFESALQQVNDELEANNASPWFLPYEHPTIVDMQYVSHIERMVASALYWKGFDIRAKFPKIDEWLTAFEELPYYVATKGDYYTHVMDIPPQYGQPYGDSSKAVEAAQAAIDASKARLPVRWELDPEPWTGMQRRIEEEEHLQEAAWKLISNSKAVARFCCRAAGPDVGKWAFANPMKASLSDPYASPNEDLIQSVDALLRIAAVAMLRGDASVARDARSLAEKEVGVPPGGWDVAAKCLEYLRDRVGVPRDMQMPAAKLFRGCLGEVVTNLRA